MFRKDEQKALEESGEIKVIKHLPIKPAFTNETSSEFYDPVIKYEKLIALNFIVYYQILSLKLQIF